MGVGHDPVVGEAAELVADHLVVLAEPGGAEAGDALALQHQRDETGAGGVGVAMRDQRLDLRRAEGGERRGGQAEVAGADDLGL